MAQLTLLPETLRADSDWPEEEPEFFAVGTDPGTPVSDHDGEALGAAPSEESRHVLRAHLAALAARSGLEVLGIEEEAGASSVQAAYEELLDRWHPAKFASAEEEVRELVAEIAIRIEHAYREASASAEQDDEVELSFGLDPEEEDRLELQRKLGMRLQESKRSLARARDALRSGDVYLAAKEFECALELAPGCREAAAGLQLVGEKKRSAHKGALQRILARGRR